MVKKNREGVDVGSHDRRLVLRAEKGQHFIVDPEAVSKLVGEIPEDAIVIEVGAGNGRLTRALANKARQVIAIEEDERFSSELQKLAKEHKNVRIVMGNALDVDFSEQDRPWIAGNIPFHITEPLMAKATRSRISGATVMVGDSFASEATGARQEKESKLGLLVRTFFHVRKVLSVDKHNFEPPPRTNATILTMTPRGEDEYASDKSRFLLRELFSTSSHGAKVKNVLMEGLIRYGQHNRVQVTESDDNPRVLTKNDARGIVSKLGISSRILEKSLEQLNNDELGILEDAIKNA